MHSPSAHMISVKVYYTDRGQKKQIPRLSSECRGWPALRFWKGARDKVQLVLAIQQNNAGTVLLSPKIGNKTPSEHQYSIKKQAILFCSTGYAGEWLLLNLVQSWLKVIHTAVAWVCTVSLTRCTGRVFRHPQWSLSLYTLIMIFSVGFSSKLYSVCCWANGIGPVWLVPNGV